MQTWHSMYEDFCHSYDLSLGIIVYGWNLVIDKQMTGRTEINILEIVFCENSQNNDLTLCTVWLLLRSVTSGSSFTILSKSYVDRLQLQMQEFSISKAKVLISSLNLHEFRKAWISFSLHLCLWPPSSHLQIRILLYFTWWNSYIIWHFLETLKCLKSEHSKENCTLLQGVE